MKTRVFQPVRIDQMLQFDRSVLIFKILNKIYPESLHDKFTERSSISKYDTRNKTDLQIPGLTRSFVVFIAIDIFLCCILRFLSFLD